MTTFQVRFSVGGKGKGLTPAIRKTLADIFASAPKGKRHTARNRSALSNALRVLGVAMPKGNKGAKVWKSAKEAAAIA